MRFSFKYRWGMMSLGLCCVWLLAGCQTARVEHPLTAQSATEKPMSQGEFWYQLAQRPLVSNDEAFHALLLFNDSADPAADYSARVAMLKQRGWLAADFNKPGDDAIERGDLAVPLVKLLGLKGGLTMRLAGATPRYALRTLQ